MLSRHRTMLEYNVLHIAEGQHWAGIEAHLGNLIPSFRSFSKEVDVKCFLLNEGQLADKLREKGVEVITCVRKRRFDLMVILKLNYFLRQKRIKVIHMHGYLAIFYGLIASTGTNVQKFITIHQPAVPLQQIKDKKFKFYLRLSYWLAKKKKALFIAVSNDVRSSWINEWGINCDDIAVIHNGIDIDDLVPNVGKQKEIKEKYQGTPETKIISIIGRLKIVKGHRYFIEAARYLLQSNNNIVFLIIGEGEQRTKLENDVKALGLERYVKFTGFKRNIIDYLAITDILIISSLYEGIPYTLLEAMALGKCVVATEVGGLKEVIQSEINGILVKKEDPNAIAMAVNLLLQDDHKRKMLGEAARERVANHYSSHVIVKEIIDIYNKVTK